MNVHDSDNISVQHNNNDSHNPHTQSSDVTNHVQNVGSIHTLNSHNRNISNRRDVEVEGVLFGGKFN